MGTESNHYPELFFVSPRASPGSSWHRVCNKAQGTWLNFQFVRLAGGGIGSDNLRGPARAKVFLQKGFIVCSNTESNKLQFYVFTFAWKISVEKQVLIFIVCCNARKRLCVVAIDTKIPHSNESTDLRPAKNAKVTSFHWFGRTLAATLVVQSAQDRGKLSHSIPVMGVLVVSEPCCG